MWEFELTVKMMSRFPNIVIRYVARKSPHTRGSSLDSFENP